MDKIREKRGIHDVHLENLKLEHVEEMLMDTLNGNFPR